MNKSTLKSNTLKTYKKKYQRLLARRIYKDRSCRYCIHETYSYEGKEFCEVSNIETKICQMEGCCHDWKPNKCAIRRAIRIQTHINNATKYI